MKIYVGEEFLDLDEDTLDYMYIDEGNESEIYRYGKDALKIYKRFCHKDRLDEDTTTILSGISTERMLLPKEIIRDESGNFIGYSMPFIYTYPVVGVLKRPVVELLDEMDVIKEDIRILSDNYVDIEDLHIRNVLYNGKLFMGDPGSYLVKRHKKRGQIYNDNMYTFGLFVRDELFKLLKLTVGERQSLNQKFDYTWDINGQMRDEVINDKETVRQFIKRMTR